MYIRLKPRPSLPVGSCLLSGDVLTALEKEIVGLLLNTRNAGRGNAGQSDSDEPPIGGSANEEDAGASLLVDETELLSDYRNTYWTGLIRVEGFVVSPEFVVDDQSFR